MKILIQKSLKINALWAIISLLGMFSWSACEDKQQNILRQLDDEVMKLHNESMPLMGDIYRLKDALKKKNDATKEDNTALKEQLLEVELALAKADDDMMHWMRQYTDGKKASKNFEEKVNFLKSQKDSIQRVNQQIYLSIATAKKYVQ